MILGVLALDFARYMRDDAMASVNLADETRGYYLALAGMNRAIFDAERRREKNGPAAPPGTAAAAPQGPHTLDEDEEDEGPLVPVDGQWHEGDFAGGRCGTSSPCITASPRSPSPPPRRPCSKPSSASMQRRPRTSSRSVMPACPSATR